MKHAKYHQLFDKNQLKIFDKNNYKCFLCFTNNKSKNSKQRKYIPLDTCYQYPNDDKVYAVEYYRRSAKSTEITRYKIMSGTRYSDYPQSKLFVSKLRIDNLTESWFVLRKMLLIAKALRFILNIGIFQNNSYIGTGISVHEDEFRIFNSPLMIMRVNHAITLGMALSQFQGNYNDCLEIDMNPGNILVLTLSFRHTFRHGIKSSGLHGNITMDDPSISCIARGIDVENFELPDDKKKWLSRVGYNRKKHKNDPRWQGIFDNV